MFSVRNLMMRLIGNVSTIPELPSPFAETPLSYIDVGARGGPPTQWLKLSLQMKYLCFEPDTSEAEALRLNFAQNPQIHALVSECALGATSGSATLYLTHSRPCSSLLKPNAALLDMFAHRGLFEVEKELSIPIVSLDAELKRLGSFGDFIKADVQGYELEVLRGGVEAVSQSIGCELEVSFIEIYKDQPLFAEVDQFMRARGFFLADLERIWWRRAAAPVEIQQRGTLAYGNAVYLKKEITYPQNRLVAIKSAIICVAIGLNELAYEIVLQGHLCRLFTHAEMASFHFWLRRYTRSNAFWYHLAKRLSFLPGRQTLGRWLGLWSRALHGECHTGSDADSWARRTSW